MKAKKEHKYGYKSNKIHIDFRLAHAIQTKGLSLKKCQKVTLVDFPHMFGTYYEPNCTIEVKKYGFVSVPKSVIPQKLLIRIVQNLRM